MTIQLDSLARFQAGKNQEEQVLGQVASLREKVDREDVKKVARDFESLFLDIVLKAMRQSVMKSGLIDGGNAEDIYRSMLDSEYSKIIAKQGATGLSEIIENQVLGKMNLGHDTARIANEISGKKVYGQKRLHEGLKSQTIK